MISEQTPRNIAICSLLLSTGWYDEPAGEGKPRLKGPPLRDREEEEEDEEGLGLEFEFEFEFELIEMEMGVGNEEGEAGADTLRENFFF